MVIPGAGDELPPVSGIEHLVEALDAAVTQRPRKGRFPVVLVTGGPETDTGEKVVRGYRNRLINWRIGGREGLVPYAVATDDKAVPPDDAVRAAPGYGPLLEHIASELQFSMPRKAGRLRLPLFYTCLQVARSGAAGSLPAVRTALVDELYEDLCRRRPWLAGLGRWADSMPGFLLPVADTVLQAPLRSLYRLWLTRTRHLRWFTDEFIRAKSTPAGNFLDAACRLVPDKRTRPPAGVRTALDRKQAEAARQETGLIQRLLLQALLRDLDRATRPNPLSVRRTRRRWPFVLLLLRMGGPNTPVRELYGDYVNIVQSISASPLLVFGALADTAPPKDVKPVQADSGEVIKRLERHQEGRTRLVRLPEDYDTAETASWLRMHPHPSVVPPRKRDHARPALLALLAVLLVLPVLGPFGLGPKGCYQAPGSSETIGVTDGQECHLGRAGDALWELERLVAEHNRAVDRRQPYRSVVFFGPLTVPSAAATPNSIQQLRGAVMAQIGLNRPGGQQAKVPIRILIANSGDAFRHGGRVAQDIIDRAERDSIAAVIGIGQSRTESQTAIRALSRAQIPVIGGSVTGDAMVDDLASPFYFQVSPPNRRIAEVAAEFARTSRELSPRPERGSRPREAIVVYNPEREDLFSQNLLEAFRAAYPQVFPVELHERVPQPTDRIAEDICTRLLRTKGFVFYAGRPPKMRELLNSMSQNDTCRNKVTADRGYLPMLASSAATTFLADRNTRMEEYPFLRLFYVSFYDPSPPSRPTPGSPSPTSSPGTSKTWPRKATPPPRSTRSGSPPPPSTPPTSRTTGTSSSRSTSVPASSTAVSAGCPARPGSSPWAPPPGTPPTRRSTSFMRGPVKAVS